MSTIKESVKAVLSVKDHKDILDKFARECYYNKFKDMKRQHGTYHSYNGFSVVSEDVIEVNFVHGAGDMDFDDSFKVNIE